MELIALKNQLSSELQKRKSERNTNLIHEIHEKINQEKIVLNKSFEVRRQEKLSESTKMKVELDKKKSVQYKRMRAKRIAEKKKPEKNASNKKYTA